MARNRLHGERRAATAGHTADVIVIGGGLVGLTVAWALAERAARVVVLTTNRSGEASPAAAGVLAPSVNPKSGAAQGFAVAARDYYPAYLRAVRERTGIDVPLNRLGVLQVALDEDGATALRAALPAEAAWIEAGALARLEPYLGHLAGAAHHPNDGAVDNVELLRALEELLARHPKVRVVTEEAARVEAGAAGAVTYAEGGGRYLAARVVLTASCPMYR